MKHTAQVTESFQEDSPPTTATVHKQNIWLPYLKFALNAMVVLVFLDHLDQVKETSRDLAYTTKLGVLLSEEADELRYANEKHLAHRKIYTADFEELEEELYLRDKNLMLMEEKIHVLEEEQAFIEEGLVSIEKMAVLALFMDPSSLGRMMERKKETEDEDYDEIYEEPWRLEQTNGRRNVLQDFGEGPYHVMIELELPPKYAVSGTTDQIVVELARLDLMPYTVNFFLKQVSAKLYDGTSFGRNAGHVLQAWPLPYFANPDADMLTPFVDRGLDMLSFQEYNDNYPHDKYTLGFAGRPGGVHFYISLEDNTWTNAPDPCFGKVVHGFEALERMQQIPTIDDDSVMVESIGIKRVTVLHNYEGSN